MKRALALLALALPPAIVACSFLRSLDGYSDQYGVDSGEDVDARCPSCRAPEVLAILQNKPHGVAVNTTRFFWTNEGDNTVMSCPTAGCSPAPSVVATKQSSPTEIVRASDDFYVYWLRSTGTVGACIPDGCDDRPLSYGHEDAGPGFGLAATEFPLWTQGTTVFFCASCSSPFGGSIVPLETNVDSPRGIAVSITTKRMPVWGTNGAVMKCDTETCADAGPVPFATGQGHVDRVIVDQQNVYWTSDGSIRACPLGGCQGPPITLADNQRPSALASDGALLYWTNGGDDTVRSCPIGTGCPNGAPTVVAIDQNDPQGIAIAPNGDLYWVSRGNGQVLRLTKQP
jgi:hypothetical protein